MISRIKIMAKLNIAERRLPQDGRIMLRVQGKELDLRVSTVPTVHGESVVMRILDRAASCSTSSALGFTDEFLAAVPARARAAARHPAGHRPDRFGQDHHAVHGARALNTPDVKILTVEDPVEYQIAGINQIQVKPQIGLDFANALRSIVRQDPDIIMIGEIRDLETAQIAIQSALTGHLVLSTLHTNDAAGGITRLLDMGVEDYLLTSTVIGILAQRLVRTPRADACGALRGAAGGDRAVRPAPVPAAGHDLPVPPEALRRSSPTGYLGRTTIMEFLVMTDALRRAGDAARRHGRDSRQPRAQGRHAHDVRGRPASRRWQGVTTIEEVLRVTAGRPESHAAVPLQGPEHRAAKCSTARWRPRAAPR